MSVRSYHSLFCDEGVQVPWDRYSVLAEDDGPGAAPRLVVTCSQCGATETMNDEDGKALLLDLARWGLRHNCAGHIGINHGSPVTREGDFTGGPE